MCGPPPGVELRVRVTLVHRPLQSVLCLTHADSDSVVLVPSPPLSSPSRPLPSPPLPSPPLLVPSPPPPLPYSQLLSGSSDGTVRLWSVIQQCCIETFCLHDEGVWTVAIDDSFSTFYSSGRDKQVCVTHLKTSTSRQLFMEEAPVIRLVLDTVDSSPSIWAATTNTICSDCPCDMHQQMGECVTVTCDMSDR